MRQMAVPARGGPLIGSDVEAARKALAGADFFGEVFGLADHDQDELHRRASAVLRAEAVEWRDEPVPGLGPDRAG